jgi:chromosome segregation ATPase
MSDKVRRNITIPPEIDAYLDKQDNASALVVRLVRAHMRGDGDNSELAGLRARRDFLSAVVENKEQEVEDYRNQVRELDKLIDQHKNEREQTLDRARRQLSTAPRKPDNPAIRQWAERLDMTPTQLIDELPDRDNDPDGYLNSTG